MVKRLEITLKPHLFDSEAESLKRKVKDYFNWEIHTIRTVRVITFDLDISDDEFELIRKNIFTNPVVHISSYKPVSKDFDWLIWVGFRPGVKDTAGSVALEAISDYLGKRLPEGSAAYTSKIFEFGGVGLSRQKMETIAREILANDLIQQWRIYSHDEWDPEEGIGFILPRVILNREPRVEIIPIPSDEHLKRLSQERNLALNPRDIPVIRAYFNRPEVRKQRAKVGLSDPTDVELEAISQARSDHCNHNTFKGFFEYVDLDTGERKEIDNLFKTCIEQPTLELQKEKDWVVSVLWDNAGVAKLDDSNYYVITGETHNSPSNMEAYGGALTGIVGVYRDIMGTGKGARMVGGLYGYCVGPRDYNGPLRPHLHPRRLLDGIVEGVRDGGNKHGVPTLYGNLYFHESYLGKCLVFVASIGIMPAQVKNGPCEHKKPEPGDLIIMCGGRVGKDGIHGVTASSEVYSEHTPAGHVQIGDPYTQKKMHDFLLEARDEGLISFITDNGGGGLSSSVGESARMAGGAYVELDKVPLKYEGLDVWEIWVSESQERMTVGVKPEHLSRFMELSRKHEVESTVIGRYEDSGKLHLTYKGKTCAYLDLSFFEEEFPQWKFEAEWISPKKRGFTEPVLREPSDYGTLLKTVLGRSNINSREWIQRQYDHEVQGTSVIKYFVGRTRDIPSDAVVIRPVLNSRKGLCVAQALHPSYGVIDTYHMVGASIDECIRRLIAVGGSLDKIGGVDNFCWPSIQFDPENNPDGKYKAAQLVRANLALKHYCECFGIPLLSGKDSMYVDGMLKGAFGERHKVSGLPTMLFTATTVVHDVYKCVSMEFKHPGDYVYVVGLTRNELGGSEYYDLFGYTGYNVPKVHEESFVSIYRTIERAIEKGLVASCHGVFRGGIAVHVALSAMGGCLGAKIDLRKVPVTSDVRRNDTVLFSESCGRFLVSVSQEKALEFEKCLDGIPFARIGEVTEERFFECVGLDGKVLFSESVCELKRAWAGSSASTCEDLACEVSLTSFESSVKRRNFTVSPIKKRPKALVLTGFGLNCDYETAYALDIAGAEAERVHLNDIINRDKNLRDYQIFVVDGGFSWGDDHGAGVIMAVRLKHRLGDELLEFVERGNLVIGICNGFQVLVNLGILPGREKGKFKREVALVANDCGNFVDRWVWLKTNPKSPCVFTKNLDVVEYPVRHGEGKFYASEDLLKQIEKNGHVVFRYAMPDGSLARGRYPFNPNGSLNDIAGICDITGRVLGLMPHPEAFNHWTNHPDWTYHKEIFKRKGESFPEEGLGIELFRNGVHYLNNS